MDLENQAAVDQSSPYLLLQSSLGLVPWAAAAQQLTIKYLTEERRKKDVHKEERTLFFLLVSSS